MALNFTATETPLFGSKTSDMDCWFLVFDILFHVAIGVIGTFGNILVLKVVLSQRKRKVSEYLILNLCATDLGACVVSVPLDLVERALRRFPFGKFMCSIVYPFQTVLMAVSVMTLLEMSYERYRLIVTPFKRRINSKIAICTIIVTWGISSLLILPYMMVLSLESDQCIEKWPLEVYRKVYTVSVFLVLYLIPLLIITISYTLVIRNLNRDSRKQIMECFESTCNRSAHMRSMMISRVQRNMKVVKIFMSAGVVFAVCMLPTHLCWLWHDFGPGYTNKHFTKLVTFSNVFMYLNSAIDPFIFGSLKVRQLCLDITCCRACRGKWHLGNLFRLRTTIKQNPFDKTEREVIHDRVTSL